MCTTLGLPGTYCSSNGITSHELITVIDFGDQVKIIKICSILTINVYLFIFFLVDNDLYSKRCNHIHSGSHGIYRGCSRLVSSVYLITSSFPFF
jgi:hypothetical protein